MKKFKLNKYIIILIFGLVFIFIIISEMIHNNKTINVIEKTNFSMAYNCEKKECFKFYYEFPKNHEKYISKLSEDELMEQIKETKDYMDNIYSAGDSFRDLNQKELKDIIIEKLNIDFLLKDIDQRILIVTKISEIDQGDYIEKELIFEDEHIGKFPVLMLVPKIDHARFPAIIGLHGHGDSNYIFMDHYGGLAFVKEGFIVIMPLFRAMINYAILSNDEESNEDVLISEELLLNGFTLMGLRVYETLLVIKYALYLDEIDNNKIGIMGHSGGSIVSNLVVRLTENIKAQVIDAESSYLDLDPLPHCETIPSLAKYSYIINDRSSLSIPFLMVPYGPGCLSNITRNCPDDEVINFFSENLR